MQVLGTKPSPLGEQPMLLITEPLHTAFFTWVLGSNSGPEQLYWLRWYCPIFLLDILLGFP